MPSVMLPPTAIRSLAPTTPAHGNGTRPGRPHFLGPRALGFSSAMTPTLFGRRRVPCRVIDPGIPRTTPIPAPTPPPPALQCRSPTPNPAETGIFPTAPAFPSLRHVLSSKKLSPAGRITRPTLAPPSDPWKVLQGLPPGRARLRR